MRKQMPELRAGIGTKRFDSGRGYVEVEKAGLLTTVQDRGRADHQVYGVSRSGAMDHFAMRVANLLVGNPEEAPVLEFTFTGPTLRFACDQVIAITGGDFTPLIDGRPVPKWQSLPVSRGTQLSLGRCRSGARGYLAVAGGIQVPPVMGSAATFLRGGYGGFEGRALKAGDQLPVADLDGTHDAIRPRPVRRRLAPELIPDYGRFRPVRVIPGPHVEAFLPEALERFWTGHFRISPASDRMGYRLRGPVLKHRERADILSTFIFPGAIQVPADGQPIVLMADCQVTGGYAVIGVVASVDLPYLAQRKPGDVLQFRPVSVAEAQQLWKKQEAFFTRLKAACLNWAGHTLKKDFGSKSIITE